MRIKPQEIIKARQLLKLSHGDFAGLVGVRRSIICKIERGEVIAEADVLERIHGALKAAGIEFVSADNEGLGVRLRKPRKSVEAR